MLDVFPSQFRFFHSHIMTTSLVLFLMIKMYTKNSSQVVYFLMTKKEKKKEIESTVQKINRPKNRVLLTLSSPVEFPTSLRAHFAVSKGFLSIEPKSGFYRFSPSLACLPVAMVSGRD